MGFYTDVSIAIHKPTFAKHALLKAVPKLLLSTSPVEVDGALHWYFESQKWYHDFPEVREVNDFLDVLEEEGDIPDTNISRYGCLLLHEDNTTETFGEPYEYDINYVCHMDCPGRDALLKQEREALL